MDAMALAAKIDITKKEETGKRNLKKDKNGVARLVVSIPVVLWNA
ncbi:hypothetical protein AB4156_22200 [Cupriavidus sp. 2MCAB6]